MTERGWTVQTFAMADLLTSYGRSLPEPPADLPAAFAGMRNRMSFWTAVKS